MHTHARACTCPPFTFVSHSYTARMHTYERTLAHARSRMHARARARTRASPFLTQRPAGPDQPPPSRVVALLQSIPIQGFVRSTWQSSRAARSGRKLARSQELPCSLSLSHTQTHTPLPPSLALARSLARAHGRCRRRSPAPAGAVGTHLHPQHGQLDGLPATSGAEEWVGRPVAVAAVPSMGL